MCGNMGFYCFRRLKAQLRQAESAVRGAAARAGSGFRKPGGGKRAARARTERKPACSSGFRTTALQAALTVMVFCGVLGYGLSGREAVPAAGTNGEVQLPILMYHSLLKDQAQQGQYVLSPDVFRQDMEYLKENGYETVVVADLLAYVRDGTPLPEHPVMVTFDDGCYNNYLYAYPVLQELGMRAVVSVIGAQTKLFTENGQENAYWSYLTLDHLKELSGSGVFEVQNHSWDLHTLGERRGCLRKRGEEETSYREFFTSDTRRVQDYLADAGLPAPTCYTYPFGACSWEPAEVVRELGFQCTLGCEEGVNTVTRDPECLFNLKRWNRPSGPSTQAIMNQIGI